MTYKKVSFMDVCNIEGGTQPPKSVFIYEPKIGYVRLLQIQDFKRSDKSVYIPDKGNLRKCRDDDILIGRYGASIGKILRGKSGAYNVALVKVVPDDKMLDRDYLYYILISPLFQNFIAGVSSRAAQAGFNKEDLENFLIPLPSLDIQIEIVDILKKANDLKKQCKKVEQALNVLAKSVFLEMFGDPRVNPNCYDIRLFGDLIDLDAPMVDPRLEQYLDLPHIGPDRIVKNTGTLIPALTSREEKLISGKFLFDQRYVLYSKIRPYLRKVALPDFQGVCSADIYPIKPIDGVVTREYLWALLLSDAFSDYTETLASRANIPKLNRKELTAYKFPLAPYEQQLKFSSALQKLKRLKKYHNSQSNSVLDICNVLLQKSFNGELNLRSTQASTKIEMQER